MKVEHALIIAAGRGSRFEAGTANRPKPLIEVAGIPLILRVVKSAQAAGIEHFTVVTGYRGEVLEEYLIREMSGMKTDVRCICNPEWERPNGISVFRARGMMPQAFALLMSDHLFDPRILRHAVSEPLESGRCRLAVDFNPSGIPDLEDATKVLAEGGRVLEIGKDIKKYNAIDTGVFVCTEGIFSALETAITRGEESLSGAVRELARLEKMEAVDVTGLFWRDVDDEIGLKDAEQAIAEGGP